jgi:hypothetical protein
MRSFYHEGQVEVDGEILTLVCNFRAIDVIESLTEKKMSEILPQLSDPPHSLIGKVLWAMLREKHEGVTLDEAAGVAFSKDGAAVGLVMGDVLRRAFNLAEEDKKPNPPKRRGRSRTSGKRG